MHHGYLDVVNSLTVKDIQEYAGNLVKQGNKVTVILTAAEKK